MSIKKTYSRYERGEHEMTADTLDKLATFYDTTVDYLIGRTDDPTNTTKKLSSVWIISKRFIHNQLHNHDYPILI